MLSRPLTWSLLSLGILVGGLAGTMVAPEGSLRLALLVMYIVLPLVLVPWAAWSISQDRATGLAAVQATAGFKLSDALVSKLLSLTTVLILFLLASLPLFWGLTSGAVSPGLALPVPYLIWGVAAGMVAVVVGLAVGASWTASTPEAVATGFGVTVGWILLGWFGPQLVAGAGGQLVAEGLKALAHASPLTWALDWSQGGTHSFAAMQHIPIGPLFLLGCAGVVLWAFPVGLQTLAGFPQIGLARAGGVIVVIVGLSVLGAGLVAWPSQPPENPSQSTSAPEGRIYIRQIVIQQAAEESGHNTRIWEVDVRLQATGPVNSTAELTTLEASGNTADLRLSSPLPIEVAFGPSGEADIELRGTLTFLSLREEHILGFVWMIDDTRGHHVSQIDLSSWPMDRSRVLSGSVGSLAVLATAGLLAVPFRDRSHR